MGVDLNVADYCFEVGSASFLHAFFSTVAVNLEHGKWGSRFPCLMRELYAGQLSSQHVKQALAEVEQIRRELKAFPPSRVVWDAEDRSKQPPWGDDISEDITDLSNYFVTSNGNDFLLVLKSALLTAAKEKKPVEIFSM